MKNGFYRRSYLINMRFQLRFVEYSLAYACLGILVMAVMLFFPLVRVIEVPGNITQAQIEAASTALYLHTRFWLAIPICLIAVAVHAMFMSHRVAGPLYRLQTILTSVKNGVLPTRFKVRKKDFFKDEIETANEMVQSLRNRLDEIHKANHGLQLSMAETQRAIKEDRLDQLQSVVQGMEVHSRHVDEAVSEFQIEALSVRKNMTFHEPVPAAFPSNRGFSLLSLLIAVAIITLVAIVVPAYASLMNQSKVVQATSDMKLMAEQIRAIFLDNGVYPATLADAGLGSKTDPWGRPYEYLLSAGAPPGKVRKDHSLHPINTDFDLYSKGADGKSAGPLTAQISQDDIIRANNSGYYGLASGY